MDILDSFARSFARGTAARTALSVLPRNPVVDSLVWSGVRALENTMNVNAARARPHSRSYPSSGTSTIRTS